MSIPAAPTLLMAVGGIALILSRWVARSRWYEVIWLSAMLGAAGLLVTEGSVSSDGGSQGGSTSSDLYAIIGQWLAWLLALLFGAGTFGVRAATERTAERFGFLSFAIAGVMLVVSTDDLVTMAIAAEIVQFAVWGLRRTDLLEMTIADAELPVDRGSLWMGVVMSCCLWLGIGLLASVTGSVQFDEVRSILIDAYTPGPNRAVIGQGSKLGLLAIGLLIAGFGARLGLIPWHLGLIENASGVRYWTAGCVIAVSQLTGAVALGRLCGTVLVGYRDETLVLLMVLAGLTGVGSAGLAALGLMPGEGRLRRLAIAVSMLQGAWLTLGLMGSVADLAASGQSLAAAGRQPAALGLFLFATGAVMFGIAGLFLVFVSVSRRERDVEFFDEFLGLGCQHPIPATVLLVLLGSLAGHPPLWGFWSNWLLMVAGLNVRASGGSEQMAPQAGLILLVVVLLMASLVAAASLIQLSRIILLERPLATPVLEGKTSALVVAVGCAAMLVIVGLLPAPLLSVVAGVRGPQVQSSPDSPTGSNKGSATAWLPRP